ncbi:YcxB family protein [Spirosoma panaciterrae]|uniref:YcxB family protein n=1 Tax=Spirosoma panaciterrae TaxID=496058 RepID=UPI001FE1E1ED|nr:YcxB family protein [Spirosoma panaciterrae]
MVLPVLMLLAYRANGKANNLFVAGFLSIGPLSWILLHLQKRSHLKKQIKDYVGSKPVQITIDEQGLLYQTDNANTALQWSYFSEYEEFEDTFTLYAEEKGAAPVVLPLHGIADNGPMKELVYHHVKPQRE